MATIVKIKESGKLMKVWSDNTDEQTYTCLELDGDIMWNIPTDYRYDEVEVQIQASTFVTIPLDELDRIFNQSDLEN